MRTGVRFHCVLNSDLWAVEIGNSIYMENVFSILTPTMTSNTSPSGKVTFEGTVLAERDAYYCFDRVIPPHSYYGQVSNNSELSSCMLQLSSNDVYGYINYHFQEPVNVRFLKYFAYLSPWIGSDGTRLTVQVDFYIEASNDGINYVRIGKEKYTNDDTIITNTDDAEGFFNLNNKDKYTDYRIVSKPTWSGTMYLIISELEYYGR